MMAGFLQSEGDPGLFLLAVPQTIRLEMEGPFNRNSRSRRAAVAAFTCELD